MICTTLWTQTKRPKNQHDSFDKGAVPITYFQNNVAEKSKLDDFRVPIQVIPHPNQWLSYSTL